MRVTVIVQASSESDILNLIVFPEYGGKRFNASVVLSEAIAADGGQILKGYTPGDQFQVEFERNPDRITRVIGKK